MTTVVNNPAPVSDSGNGSSFLVGVILLIVFVLVLLYFGLPVIQRMSSGTVEVNIPAPNIVLPEKLDVNVSQEK